MPKLEIAPIEFQRTGARLLEESDLPMTLEWRNKPRIHRWFKFSERLSPEQHRKWYQDYLNETNDYTFILYEKELLKKSIGLLSLYDIQWSSHRAEIGRFLIGENDALGKWDWIDEIMCGFYDYWSSAHNINLFTAEVKSDNQRGLRLFNFLGYETVGEGDGLVQLHYTGKKGEGIGRGRQP